MPWIEMPEPRTIPGMQARARQGHEWYRIKNASSDEAEIFLYDEVGGWGTYADEFVEELKAITAPKIRLRVNSPGGSVFEGLACANALRSHPAEVTVQVDGIAASIASVIAMAADRVIVQPQAMLMLHDAAGVCLGNAQDMQEMADLLDKISDNIAGAYASKAGGTAADWRQVMVKETWYTAEEAVEAGLADEMLSSRKQQAEPDGDEPEMRREFDFAAYGYRGPQRSEPPKPAPPPQPPAPVVEPATHDVTLCTSIGAAIGEQLAAAIRNAVAFAAEPAPAAEPAAPVASTVTEPPAEDPPAHGADLAEPVEPVVEEPETPSPEPAAPAPEPVTPEPVAEQPPPEAPAEPERPVAPAPEPEAEPEPEQQPEADEWNAAVARLTTNDPWGEIVARLTTPSSADDEFTRLKEALL